MAVTKRTRYEVLRRDNHACRYCGCMAPDVKLTIDHVIPKALGGSDDPSNLVTACVDCNAGKSSMQPDHALVDDIGADALRWSRAMSRAAALVAEQDAPRDAYLATFYDRWDDFRYGPEDDKRAIPMPNGWRDSVGSFYKAGLPEAQMVRAIQVAMSKDSVAPAATFRYFCGVCWRMLDDIRAVAVSILAAEDADNGA